MTWMPRACPAERRVSSYTSRLHAPLLPRFARGEATAGKARKWTRTRVCSEKRKYPPDKPGAFAEHTSQGELW